MSTGAGKPVRYEKVPGGVALVMIDRPHVLNALDVATKVALGSAWRAAAEDHEVRAVVVAGEGDRAFCAGSDMKEMARTGRTASTEQLFGALPGLGVDVGKPVIAALHGHCLGMGLTLALHADLRVARTDTRLGLPEVAHGAISAVTSVRLPLMIPAGRAAQLLITGRTLSATEAADWGLVDRVVEGDATAEALSWAASIAASPAPALRHTLRLARSVLDAAVRARRTEIDAARAAVEASAEFTAGARGFGQARLPAPAQVTQ